MEVDRNEGVLRSLRLPSGTNFLNICTNEKYQKLTKPFEHVVSSPSIRYSHLSISDTTTQDKLNSALVLGQNNAGIINLKNLQQDGLIYSLNIVDCIGICVKNPTFLYVAHFDDAHIAGGLKEFNSKFIQECEFLPTNTEVFLISSHLTPKVQTVFDMFSSSGLNNIYVDIGHSYLYPSKSRKDEYIPLSSIVQHCSFTEKDLKKRKEKFIMDRISQDRKKLNIYSPRTILINTSGILYQINSDTPWEDSRTISMLKAK